ncbi:MAG: helix-turn-helix domain-containing protein [Planctomycetes bacterium]|nr:helix-turn-helix domain-containing protein [Planctomycetota bacterium]
MSLIVVRKPENEHLVLDVRSAARELTVSTRTIHRLLKRGDLKAFRCGRRVGVLTESLRAFAAQGGAA